MKGNGYLLLTMLQTELEIAITKLQLLKTHHGDNIIEVYPFYQETIKTLQRVTQYNQDCWNAIVGEDVAVLDNRIKGINLHRELISTRMEQFDTRDKQMELKKKIDTSSKDFNKAMTVIVGSVIGLIIIAVVSGL